MQLLLVPHTFWIFVGILIRIRQGWPLIEVSDRFPFFLLPSALIRVQFNSDVISKRNFAVRVKGE